MAAAGALGRLCLSSLGRRGGNGTPSSRPRFPPVASTSAPSASSSSASAGDGEKGSRESFVVPGGGGRGSKSLRLDSFLSERLTGRNLSRARIQESVRAGTATVNGRVQVKPAHKLWPGDEVVCVILERPPLDVEPEDIPLDVVYEDATVLVVDKPAGLVVHPAPGNHGGTLVNAVLHHCNLPALRVAELGDGEDDVEGGSRADLMYGNVPVPRPGIVHRLDKGTSGLMVVAKDDLARESLQAQFRERTVEREYLSIVCGELDRGGGGGEGRVVTAIGRDVRERTRMAAFPAAGAENKPHLKRAASRFAVREVLAGGLASLVSWRLETGRTHQIRVHAKFLGAPLFGDPTYGGKLELAPRGTSMDRPALHAATLGFDHPRTGERLTFRREPPQDFEQALRDLRLG
ncbi:RNA pseudouridine synthase [Chloropicon roscoffensis]|uniref:Pseudouridine synthase n=2 Tax=Chloropicon roscoffensis TaxID=1461544 RepID=A0AAX4NXV0_9CHLO